ncbi:chaperone modulator CbpM [Psychrobacter sp. NPDC078370]|jgi:chaperone modulatory protein CbpM|uniref:chaperone modulator CbpM n=1 Tax=unclassified Psychrobacter TaxID=196806 RepID=UPI000C33C403|nr:MULTISPECIES: chaperone modulator CbpM [unclassified Psychrobacter]MBA6244998.1 MerR family transcriptional regulator [Psychrobacter sp. Urea-trap-18]MBA6286543.1 MerR family transcriptional regulator [Psychrobacter sp. Urea-trap-16]MBA6318554.1 MerR family transcriptional regulator [Psychrobacter sp. Urea-trap-20]MBA6334775.1 MerR family transcriptional regulator [Psychrobacter sp. Urea-trap-19]MDN3441212.1 chaperone modulator CbpM [Psychrobacter sp. APC 3279]
MNHSTEFTDIIMSLDELVSACGQERQWVIELIEENIIEYDVPEHEKFTGYQLTTVRRASRLSRDFEASVPAIGLILELLDEVEQLRQLKRQIEQQTPVIEVDIDHLK